jgi:glycosyltransferase involved in cell wall biosynthesis
MPQLIDKTAPTEKPPQEAIKRINVLAFVEARTVTGPAKNLFEYIRYEKTLCGIVDTRIVTFSRLGAAQLVKSFVSDEGIEAPTDFIKEALKQDLQVDTIQELFRYDPLTLNKIRKIVDTYKPDIIQTHSVKSHFLIYASGLYKQYPWIAFHHGYTKTNLKMELYNKLDKISLKKPQKIITVSDSFASELTAIGIPKNDVQVIRNSVNSRVFSHITEGSINQAIVDCRVKDGETIILTIGRLSKEKGHEDLINAFHQLLQEEILQSENQSLTAAVINSEYINAASMRNYKLVIVGEGPEMSNLEAQIKDLQLEDKVLLIGFRKDVRPFYHICDLFVLPSHSEGSPNVLLEAMAAKIPVVATRVGGIPEMVEEGKTAILCEANKTDSIKMGMRKIIEDEALRKRLVQNAFQNVLDNYSPEKRREILTSMYIDVIASGAHQK